MRGIAKQENIQLEDSTVSKLFEALIQSQYKKTGPKVVVLMVIGISVGCASKSIVDWKMEQV